MCRNDQAVILQRSDSYIIKITGLYNKHQAVIKAKILKASYRPAPFGSGKFFFICNNNRGNVSRNSLLAVWTDPPDEYSNKMAEIAKDCAYKRH